MLEKEVLLELKSMSQSLFFLPCGLCALLSLIVVFVRCAKNGIAGTATGNVASQDHKQRGEERGRHLFRTD
jgi:hypothetical protein